MARLGAVVGGILAELAQARVIADRLTRELVPEYEGDPILAGMSVPRVTLGEATVTLRFTVDDLEEVQPELPNAAAQSARWHAVAAARLFPKTLERLGVTGDERKKVLDLVAVDQVGARAMSAAMRGDIREAITATTEGALETWTDLPVELRRHLGGKVAFRKELQATAAAQLKEFLDAEASQALLRSVLASKLDVGVRTADLPAEPERIQEIQLKLTGEDFDLVLKDV